MKAKNKIGVIVRYYSQKIGDLRNVFRALENQTDKNFRVIVVNDGCDFAEKITQEAESSPLDVVVLHHEMNYGRGMALKTAIDYVRTHDDIEYVMTLDADDVWVDDAVERMHEEIAAHSKPTAIVTEFDTSMVGADYNGGVSRTQPTNSCVRRDMYDKMMICPTPVMEDFYMTAVLRESDVVKLDDYRFYKVTERKSLTYQDAIKGRMDNSAIIYKIISYFVQASYRNGEAPREKYEAKIAMIEPLALTQVDRAIIDAFKEEYELIYGGDEDENQISE